MKQNHLLSVRNVTVMAMFGALAAVLMIFEVPLPFIAPSFYGMDISEVPVLVGTFALGPWQALSWALVKILVKLILKPTSTGFVGEFANFCFGCSLMLPAGIIYRLKKTKKGAVMGMAAGTVIMTIVAVILNAVVMLPFYSHFMPLDTIIAAGAAINPAISNVWTFVILAVGPFNILKGAIVSLLTALSIKGSALSSIRIQDGGRLRLLKDSHPAPGVNEMRIQSVLPESFRYIPWSLWVPAESWDFQGQGPDR